MDAAPQAEAVAIEGDADATGQDASDPGALLGEEAAVAEVLPEPAQAAEAAEVAETAEAAEAAEAVEAAQAQFAEDAAAEDDVPQASPTVDIEGAAEPAAEPEPDSAQAPAPAPEPDAPSPDEADPHAPSSGKTS
jgi:segregation and condensation protein B